MQDKISMASVAMQQAGQTMVGWGKEILNVVGDVIETTVDWTSEVAQQEFVMKNLDKSTQQVIKSASKNAEVIGMTEQQYKNASTEIASFYKNAGQTSAIIDKMIPSAMQLVGDMAAFANTDVETAMGDFKSALMGNFETMDKYGVSLSVATINQSEYAKELGKTWEQMTEAEKQMAIMNETQRLTADYTGLAQQEAGEFGSQMKTMKQTIEEATAALGEALLPVLTPIVEKIKEVAEKVGAWAKENPELAQTVMMVVAGVGAFLVVGGTLLTILGVVAGAMAAVSAAGGIMAVVIGAITSPVTIVIAALAALVAAGIALYQNWDTIKEKASLLKERLLEAFENIKAKVKGVIDEIKAAWESFTSIFTKPINAVLNLGKSGTNNYTKTKAEQAKGKAIGQNYVPYDGYAAILHQGEAVLARRDADKWRNGKGNNGIQIAKIADTIIIREEADIDKITSGIVRKINQQRIVTS